MQANVKQIDQIIVDGYIHRHIIQRIHNFQCPKDLKNLILSFYHNPSYFIKAGDLSTVNIKRNIVTFSLSEKQIKYEFMKRYATHIGPAVFKIVIAFIIIVESFLLGLWLIDNKYTFFPEFNGNFSSHIADNVTYYVLLLTSTSFLFISENKLINDLILDLQLLLV